MSSSCRKYSALILSFRSFSIFYRPLHSCPRVSSTTNAREPEDDDSNLRKTGFSPSPPLFALDPVWTLEERKWARHHDGEDWTAWACKEALETTR
jgi:hypothetical protein